jgi:hypothetical protein
MNFRSIRDKRIDKFGKKKNGAGSPYGNQQALFIFFYCVQAETKKKINYLFFFYSSCLKV